MSGYRLIDSPVDRGLVMGDEYTVLGWDGEELFTADSVTGVVDGLRGVLGDDVHMIAGALRELFSGYGLHVHERFNPYPNHAPDTDIRSLGFIGLGIEPHAYVKLRGDGSHDYGINYGGLFISGFDYDWFLGEYHDGAWNTTMDYDSADSTTHQVRWLSAALTLLCMYPDYHELTVPFHVFIEDAHTTWGGLYQRIVDRLTATPVDGDALSETISTLAPEVTVYAPKHHRAYYAKRLTSTTLLETGIINKFL